MGMVWLAKNDISFPVLSGPNHDPATTFLASATSARRNLTSQNLASQYLDTQYLNCGSLIVETKFDLEKPASVPLLQCKISEPVNSQFLLSIGKDGSTTMLLQLGEVGYRLRIDGDNTQQQTQLRITFSWDVQNNTALLSVESPENGSLSQAETNAPLPMPMEIINALLEQKLPANVDVGVTFLGVSNQIEPVGFAPSIAKQSLIDTPNGPMPIENLLCGDLVATADNGPQPIRWICERTVPTRGLFQPLRLRAPFFGLKQDILVAPEQRLVFENTEIEYLFGVESVLVEARHLANNVNVIRETASADSISLYQLLFDNHEIITVSGCQMESLYIGQIANHPDMLKSTLLSGLPPADVPYHKEIARPLLRSYEAMALQSGVFH